ncbi:MAG TPA: TolC family protein [Gemmataceae bacterium]|nr:TolC family protein [Gemmataceae bacterium]
MGRVAGHGGALGKLAILAGFLVSVPARAGDVPAPCPGKFLHGLTVSEGQAPPRLELSQGQTGDKIMPINLPTALQLADARPIIIAAAQASLRLAIAQLRRVQVIWLPNLAVGGTWYRHDGGGTGNSGTEYTNGRDQYFFGLGPLLDLPLTDLLYLPRQAKDNVAARQFDVQSSKNTALRSVANAYFNVQQARGRMAGAQDVVGKARSLVRTIEALSKDLVSPIEVDRARTELADIESEMLLRYQEWRETSADLTRELRLNPIAVVAPLEPPHLQVTLISPKEAVEELVPVGLVSRPELASQQALVKYTLDRLRQERMRPLLPSLIIAPNAVPASPYVTEANPYGSLMTGIFSSDVNGRLQPWVGRFDSMTMLIWELQNFGFGNRALVRQRAAERQHELTRLFRLQDQVASEVMEAHAQVQSALFRISKSESEVKEARTTYEGNLKAISETTRFGDQLVLVNRPLEVVVALEQLARAYDNYFVSVSDYNKAQFQLYWALGYPASVLACEKGGGEIVPVDTSRPPQMAPVDAPPPCQGCPR